MMLLPLSFIFTILWAQDRIGVFMEEQDLDGGMGGIDLFSHRRDCTIGTRPMTGYWQKASQPGKGNWAEIRQSVTSSSKNERFTTDFQNQIVPGIDRNGFSFGDKADDSMSHYPGVAAGGNKNLLEGFGAVIARHVAAWRKGSTKPIVKFVGPAASDHAVYFQWIWVIHSTCGTLRYNSFLYKNIPINKTSRPCCFPNAFATDHSNGKHCTQKNAVIVAYAECPIFNANIEEPFPEFTLSPDELQNFVMPALPNVPDDDNMPDMPNPYYPSGAGSMSVGVQVAMAFRNTFDAAKNNAGWIIFVGLIAGVVAMIVVANKARKGYTEIEETDSLLSVAA